MVLTYIRPDADDTDGGWTDDGGATTLFDHIDESSATDSDYIQSSNNPDHDIVKLRLSDPAVSLLQRPATVRYRYRKKGDPNQSMNLTATLLQGSTAIASWTHSDIDTSFTTAEQTLTEAQFNSISDFTDLFIQFDAYSDWWLADSMVDMDFEADLYHLETADSAHFLMHADLQAGEVDGSTVFKDATGRHSLSLNGTFEVDTAQSKFGGASALISGSSYCDITSISDFAFGTGAFTIDCWMRFANVTATQFVFHTGGGTDDTIVLFLNSSSKLIMFASNADRITGGTSLSVDTWYHIELARSGSSTKLFLNGTQEGSTYTDSTNYTATSVRIGGSGTGNRWADEVRVINGTAAHTTTFTPPTTPYSAPLTGPYTQLSCTRASPATTYAKTSAGALTAFGANLLRITDLGLLVEDARENLCIRSQELDNASWTKTNATISANATTAPDGTSTADKIVESAGAGTHECRSTSFAQASSTTASYSFYAKSAGRTFAHLDVSDGATGDVFAYFNLSDGTTANLTTSGSWSAASASTELLADGWVRCIIIATKGGGTSAQMFIYPASNSSTISYTGDGSSGIHVWGVQGEVGAFPSSYIPTTSASVTRSADTVTAIGSLSSILTSNSPQSGLIDCKTIVAVPATLDWPVISNAGGNPWFVRAYSDTTSHFLENGILELTSDSPSALWSTGLKTGYSLNWRNASLVAGGDASPGTGSADIIGLTSPTLGGTAGGSASWFGYFRRLTNWSSRLADATLQSYTDPGTTLDFPADDQVRVDLDFENGQYYVSSPYEFLSCSRASTGYATNSDGTLTLFPANALRIGDGTGLLVEDARTNVCPYSQSTGDWTLADGSFSSAGAITAPDGTLTVTKFTPNTNNSSHGFVRTGTSGKTLSIYLKAAGYNYAALRGTDGGNYYAAVIDLTTGLITDTHTTVSPTGTSSSGELLANGWVRLIITQANNTEFIVAVSNSATPTWNASNVPTFTGDGSSGIYWWGAQCEAADFASSYIPTTSSSATRAADVVTAIGALNSTLSNNAASVVASLHEFSAPMSFVSTYLPTFVAGTDQGVWYLQANSSTQIYMDWGGAITANFGSGDFSDSKVGASVDRTQSPDAFSVVANAGTVSNGSNTPGTYPTGWYIGRRQFGFYSEAYFRRLTGWTSRLADATLQGHTAP